MICMLCDLWQFLDLSDIKVKVAAYFRLMLRSFFSLKILSSFWMNWIMPQFSDSKMIRETRQDEGQYTFSADLPEAFKAGQWNYWVLWIIKIKLPLSPGPPPADKRRALSLLVHKSWLLLCERAALAGDRSGCFLFLRVFFPKVLRFYELIFQ